MADDELISLDSTTVFDDTFILDVNDPDDYGPELETADVPLDPRDITKVGLTTKQDIEAAISFIQQQPLGFQTPEERADLIAALNSQLTPEVSSIGFTRRPSRDPYVFKLTPISGLNQSEIPDAGIIFPLPPEKFEVARPQEPRTYVAINQQEFSLPGPRSLFDVAIEGMLPYTNPATWSLGGDNRRPAFLPQYITGDTYRTPQQIIGWLEKLMMNAQPVMITIAPPAGATDRKAYGGLVGVNYVTVTNFTYGEAFGHVADYVFSLQLKQWRGIYTQVKDGTVTQPASTGNNTTTTTTTTTTKTTPAIKSKLPGQSKERKTYVVRSGDTLWDISARFLGTGTRWMEIYKLNRQVINDECKKHGVSTYPRGWHIWPGTRLKMPTRGLRDG